MEQFHGKVKITTLRIIIKIMKTVFLMPDGMCRFEPTCSIYAEEAMRSYTLPKAILLIFYRILRCNPLNKGGYDPIVRRK